MIPLHFRRLQTRLAVLYAALFGLVFLVIASAAAVVFVRDAARTVTADLQAGGEVFGRLWELRSQRLEEGGELLAHDFGFLQAVATGDGATVGSALESLRGRLRVRRAFVLGTDGRGQGGHDAIDGVDLAALAKSLDPEASTSGVLMIAGRPYQATAAPILAPDPLGWLVFATPLDRDMLAGIEHLSAIPLDARVVVTPNAIEPITASPRALAPSDLTLTRPLQVLGGQLRDGRLPGGVRSSSRRVALVLSYPLSRALAPYRRTAAILLGVGALGGLMMAAGAWLLARGVARPIAELDDAARAVREGREVVVALRGRDELSRLAESFNHMSATIRDREAAITHLALHDAYTGLPNLRGLEGALERGRTRSDPTYGPDVDGGGGTQVVALAAVGIDRFAAVRAAIGQELSHRLVGDVATRLATLAVWNGATVFIARLTNDKLALIYAARDGEDALRIAGEVADAMRTPVALGAVAVDVAVTVGLALAAEEAVAPRELIDRASVAVYQARGRHLRSAIYDPVAYGDPAAQLSLMGEMLAAMQSGAFQLHHQPKLDLRRGRITGVEALARWTHPTRGRLAPDTFVTLAEETGHIREMTDWVLDRAIEDRRRLASRGYALTMSVNLSGRLLADDGFIERALARTHEDAPHLCFEITETAVIDDPVRAIRNVGRLVEAGATVSIDDYGSGLSSLSYLSRIPAQELKIDKAFVLRMDASAREALLVRSTIDLAHGLGMKVTAEGVETPAALALLAGMGCDRAQGYHIARPMPLEALLEFLDDAAADERADGRVRSPSEELARSA